MIEVFSTAAITAVTSPLRDGEVSESFIRVRSEKDGDRRDACPTDFAGC